MWLPKSNYFKLFYKILKMSSISFPSNMTWSTAPKQLSQ